MKNLNDLPFKKIKIKKNKTNKIFFILYILIIIILFLLIIIGILLYRNSSIYSIHNNFNLKEEKLENKTQKDLPDTVSKNIQSFSHQFLILLLGKNCPNKNLRTIYFPRNNHKRKYDKPNNWSFSNENRIREFNYYNQTFYTETKDGIREKIFKNLGIKLSEIIGIHSLYMTNYLIDKKFKNKIKNHIVNKYQKINRFFNYRDYISKSLLYKNYIRMKNIFPDDYNYMLETYSNPEDEIIISHKFNNYLFKNFSKSELWLVKPQLGRLGKSISFLKNRADIKKGYLITKFLPNPHLIRGYMI